MSAEPMGKRNAAPLETGRPEKATKIRIVKRVHFGAGAGPACHTEYLAVGLPLVLLSRCDSN
jgi:hypothetical protein